MKKKALIVDAEPSTRDALIKTLSQFYDVVSASDGEEAVEVYERELPDLILTDLNLPNMTAFDLRRVLQERHRDMIPMMFMSSEAGENRRYAISKTARSTISASRSRTTRYSGAWETSCGILTACKVSNAPPTPTP